MKIWSLLSACSLLMLTTGCGEPALYPVKGTVLFEGKPMKGGGSIALMPTVTMPGKTAGGVIETDGTFELMTNKPSDGSMPGEFRVIIHQVVEQEGEATKDGERVSNKKNLTVAPEDRIPNIYHDIDRSPITIKVENKPLNMVTIELKRKP